MWKLILKNLWSRRRRNGWLLAELISGNSFLVHFRSSDGGDL